MARHIWMECHDGRFHCFPTGEDQPDSLCSEQTATASLLEYAGVEGEEPNLLPNSCSGCLLYWSKDPE